MRSLLAAGWHRSLFRLRLLPLLLLISPLSQANTGLPRIAIIIDDLGYQQSSDEHIIAMQAPLTVAILPHTPNSRSLASRARSSGKDVMVHLPMQAEHRNELLGPGALTRTMNREQIGYLLRAALQSVPEAIGVNNHMGSLLTRDQQSMRWLMQEMSSLPELFFIDSRTTAATVAANMAASYRIPHLSRDVFLDNDPQPEAIHRQLLQLYEVARERGQAIGIGHPHLATLDVLNRHLPELESSYGVQLVPVHQLFHGRDKRRN